MDCISNLARKNLKKSKSKNILVILSIALSTCLITAIGILAFSIHNMAINSAILDAGGSYHCVYQNINKKQFDILKNNREIQSIGESIPFSESKGKVNISFVYVDSEAAKMTNIEIQKGHLPKNDDEIAMESWLIKKLNVKPELGQKVHTDYGDFTLSGILKNDKLHVEVQKFSQAAVSKNFVLKKIKDAPRLYYVKVKSKTNIENKLFSIAHNLKINDKDVSINTGYLHALSDNLSTILPFIIIGMIVVLATVIVIYNIFYVSVIQRINYFGLLMAIGTTKKQIKKIIFKEGFFLSAIGVPIGIILGHILSFMLIPLFSISSLEIKSSPFIVLISVLVCLITIVISLRKPGKFASKISPIEAMGYTGANIGTNRKERTSYKKFSISKLAYLNLFRNKKRTFMTILSLTMSGILFIVICSILKSMNINNLMKQDINYEFTLSTSDLSDSNEDPFNNSTIIDNIKKINGVKNVYTTSIYYDLTIDNDSENCLYGYDDDILKALDKHIISGKISTDDLKNKDEVLVVQSQNKNAHKYKVGDKVSLIIKKHNKASNKTESVKKEFTVKGILDKNFNETSLDNHCNFVVHKDTLARITGNNSIYNVLINIDKNNFKDIKSELKKLTDSTSNIDFYSYTEDKKETENQYKGIEIAAISLIVIIGIIGMLNFINTMITSILTRKKEFGMLQAIGLSNSQLGKMIQIEGLYYSLTSAIISITFGTGLGYLCFKLFKKTAYYAEYEFPLMPILLLASVFIVIEFLVSLMAHHNIKKDSIIDRIRYNE